VDKTQWINVKEKLPPEQGLYLCCGRTIDWNMGKIPDVAFTAEFLVPDEIYDYHRWIERTRNYEDVTIEYWMVLPELPKDIYG
jgi:hypothetical protein